MNKTLLVSALAGGLFFVTMATGPRQEVIGAEDALRRGRRSMHALVAH
jgi:hypothetical protein